MKDRALAEAVMLRVVANRTCVEWAGPKTPQGYGLINSTQKNGKPTTRQVHRVVFEAMRGPIPSAMVIDHKCHNPACVNVQHLRAVTRKQNAEHRTGAQRNNKSSGVRGVYWHAQTEKWRAMVRHNQRLISAGLFETVAQAEAAIVAKRNELFTHNDRDRAALRYSG